MYLTVICPKPLGQMVILVTFSQLSVNMLPFSNALTANSLETIYRERSHKRRPDFSGVQFILKRYVSSILQLVFTPENKFWLFQQVQSALNVARVYK